MEIEIKREKDERDERDKMVGSILTGKDFIDLFPTLSSNLFIFTNKSDMKFSNKIETGINSFNVELIPTSIPKYDTIYTIYNILDKTYKINGGLELEDYNNIHSVIGYGHSYPKGYQEYYRKAILLPECKVYINKHNITVDKVELDGKIKIEDLKIWEDIEFCKKAITCDANLIKHFKNLNEEKLIAIVSVEGYSIEFIEDPSEEVQLAAVSEKGHSIRYIKSKNISESVKLAAVKRSPLAIKYIKNPSEEVQITAVSKNGDAIMYIKDPSEEVLIAAVKQRGSALSLVNYEHRNGIRFKIVNVSDRVKIEAINRCSWIIHHLFDMSDEVQDFYCERYHNTRSFEYIVEKKISDKMKIKAINYRPSVFKHIVNPSEEMKMAAVMKNCFLIKYIKDPSKDMQLAAVKQNGYSIKYIESPSEEVQLAALNQNKKCIKYIKNLSESFQYWKE